MLRTCNACGQENRIPAGRLSDSARCGACKAALPAQNEPLNVGPAEFAEIVAQAKVPVLVDFWAAWCGPCRMAAPHVAKAAHNLAGRALVLKVDTDQHAGLAQKFGVRGIPHFVVLKDGKQVVAESGLVDHRQLERWLTEAR